MLRLNTCDGCVYPKTNQDINTLLTDLEPVVATITGNLLDINADFAHDQAAAEASGSLNEGQRAHLDQIAAKISDDAGRVMPRLGLIGIAVDEIIVNVNEIRCDTVAADGRCPRGKVAIQRIKPLIIEVAEAANQARH